MLPERQHDLAESQQAGNLAGFDDHQRSDIELDDPPGPA